MTRWFGNLMALAVSLLLMAGLFELACRTVINTGLQYHLEMWKYAVTLKRVSANPEIGHEHVPAGRARLMGADVSINGQGLRHREIDMAKPPGSKRILMLGDSIVFGWGVDQSETLPAQLERILRDRGPDILGGPVDVINTGVGNYNTAMEVAAFLERGRSFAPDIVVLNYFINDAEPTPVYRDVPWLARHAYAYAVLGGAWDGLRRRVTGAQDWRSYYGGLYADGAPGWRKVQESVAVLADYCRTHGIRLIMTNIPELRDLRPYPFTTEQSQIREVAKANAIEFVELLGAVEAEDPKTLWVTAPDPHPNARAHGLMAQHLAAYLVDHPVAPAP